MKRISDPLISVLRHLKAEGIIDNIRVIKASRRALSVYRADVKGFDRGILFVWANNPERRFEISARKTEIINSINSLIGEKVIKDIRFRRKGV